MGSAWFDANGNLTSRVYDPSGPKTLVYTYDDENRLVGVSTDSYYTPEGSRWKTEFVYDGLSRLRICKEYTRYPGSGWYPNGETRYLYDGRRVIQERNGSNVPTVT